MFCKYVKLVNSPAISKGYRDFERKTSQYYNLIDHVKDHKQTCSKLRINHIMDNYVLTNCEDIEHELGKSRNNLCRQYNKNLVKSTFFKDLLFIEELDRHLEYKMNNNGDKDVAILKTIKKK